MKTALSVALALLLFCSLALPLAATEVCPKENCLEPEKCDMLIRNNNLKCTQPGTQCCSIVKEEFRTHCRHHGGGCMKACNIRLQRPAVDCPNEVCCVLV